MIKRFDSAKSYHRSYKLNVILDYGIYVIDQNGDDPFNRAMLLNIGVEIALNQSNYDCFIFHDVDLLPEDDRILYKYDHR